MRLGNKALPCAFLSLTSFSLGLVVVFGYLVSIVFCLAGRPLSSPQAENILVYLSIALIAGPFTAIISIITGIIALQQIARSEVKLRGKWLAIVGIIAGMATICLLYGTLKYLGNDWL